jgi:hypothetical protein
VKVGLVNHLFDPLHTNTAVDTALIEMSSTFPSAKIYYTLGGSTPDTNGLVYTAPFSLTQTATIRAVAYGTNAAQQAEADPVSVTIFITTPHIASVSGLAGNQTIGLMFDELVGAGVTNVANYRLSNGAAITNVVFQSDGMSVQLFVAAAFTNGVQLTVNGVTNLVGHVIATNTTVSVPLMNLLLADIGQPPTAGKAFSVAPGAVTVYAGDGDIAGGGDVFNFLYAPRTGDFDVAVQVSELQIGAKLPKAGLMVRKSLDAGSPELSALATPANTLGYWLTLYRALTNGPTTNWPTSFMPQGLPYPNVWIRLQR